MGVPVAFVSTYAHTMSQISSALQAYVRSHGAERLIFGHALRTLQGRLEGIGLAWYVMNGEHSRSDEQLMEAALAWRATRGSDG